MERVSGTSPPASSARPTVAARRIAPASILSEGRAGQDRHENHDQRENGEVAPALQRTRIRLPRRRHTQARQPHGASVRLAAENSNLVDLRLMEAGVRRPQSW